jgi:beta-glucosidase
MSWIGKMLVNHTWRPMHNRKSSIRLFLGVMAAFGAISAASILVAQNADRPWMNPSLTPEERADLVLKQMTLDEKLALLHGNGMAHSPDWQMPLSQLTLHLQ